MRDAPAAILLAAVALGLLSRQHYHLCEALSLHMGWVFPVICMVSVCGQPENNTHWYWSASCTLTLGLLEV